MIRNSPNLKTNFFRNLKILKFGMPNKITPKSQTKNKTHSQNTYFLTIFDSKKV